MQETIISHACFTFNLLCIWMENDLVAVPWKSITSYTETAFYAFLSPIPNRYRMVKIPNLWELRNQIGISRGENEL